MILSSFDCRERKCSIGKKRQTRERQRHLRAQQKRQQEERHTTKGKGKGGRKKGIKGKTCTGKRDRWNSFPVNVLFEITNVWSNPNPNDHVYSTDFSNVSNFDNYNFNNLQFQDNRGYVELKHQFSDCNSSWKPMTYRYAIDSVRTQIELIQGSKLNSDTYVSIIPNVKTINSVAVSYTHLTLPTT